MMSKITRFNRRPVVIIGLGLLIAAIAASTVAAQAKVFSLTWSAPAQQRQPAAWPLPTGR